MFLTFPKSLPKPPRWKPPCWRTSSKSKKPCASTRTRPFLPNRNRSSCQTTACWYSSRRADYADRSYFYLPTPQNLSTKSARAVENFNRPGAVVFPFWGQSYHFCHIAEKKLVETYRFNELCCLSVTKKIPIFETSRSQRNADRLVFYTSLLLAFSVL